ncbi:hypothetical protein V2J09_010719 [Rumex salicifolius]
MACLCRIRQARVNRLISQLKRSYFQVSAPCLSEYLSQNKLPSRSNRQQILGLLGSSNGFSDNVRFFAAPVQSKKKEEANKSKGPRLNEQIKSHMVRLVTDEGHEIVPIHVALGRAKSLDCDLVEVNSNAKPIVCKIMDYHLDRYQQQLKEKERSKNKAESSVRKGSCKEVRISLKIEQKDLEMKADMTKRLMERGYRVKCTVQGSSTPEEDLKARAAMVQKLKGLIDRLHALIEDVAFVESGPIVEKSQAYVLVRHIKFGPSKKGGKSAAAKSADPPSLGRKKDTESTGGASGPIQHPADDLIVASQHSGLGDDNEGSFFRNSDATGADEKIFDMGDDLKIECRISDQEKEIVPLNVDSNPPQMPRVEKIIGTGADSSENRYSRQNSTKVAGKRPMWPPHDRSKMPQAPNFTDPSENRYSRRPPGPAQQQQQRGPDPKNFIPLPPPRREIPMQNPTTSDGISPPTGYEIFSSSSSNLPRNQSPINDGNSPFGITKTQAPASSQESPDSFPTDNTNISSGLFSGDGMKNANAGFTKTLGPHSVRSNPNSPLKENANLFSGLFSGDSSKNANSTPFGIRKTQGPPSVRPNPDSPIKETANVFSGLFSGDSSKLANTSPFGLKKMEGVRLNPDSPQTENMSPFSGLCGGDSTNAKASRTFPNLPKVRR